MLIAGCSDFSKHRFGGVRRDPEPLLAKGNPTPALFIPNPPAVARAEPDEGIKQAEFAPKADPKIQIFAHPLRVLHERAAAQHAKMDSYIYRFKRREAVNGSKRPEELMLVKLRREPYSVYLKWLGNQSKGREVIYVDGKYENKLQVLTADGDVPFVPAGKHMTFAIDSILVRSNTRYPITETGLAPLIDRFGKAVAGVEKGDPSEGTLKYLGKVNRAEFKAQVEAVHQVLPANPNSNLPKGGQRWWYFDASSGLPVLFITHDPDGEVEYYCHDHIQSPVHLDEDDFNPDRLWKK